MGTGAIFPLPLWSRRLCLATSCSTTRHILCSPPMPLTYWMHLPFLWQLVYSVILARNSIYAIACYMLSPVCLSVTCVDQSKTVEVRIMQLSPQSNPVTLVSSWLTSLRNSKENREWGRRITESWKRVHFQPISRHSYLRNGARYDHGYYDELIGTLLGSCICAFDWCQNHRPWMT